jgi:hypothetical protein
MARQKRTPTKKRGSKNLLDAAPSKKKGRRTLTQTGNEIIDRENADKTARRKKFASESGPEMKKIFLKKFVKKYGSDFLKEKWPNGEIDVTYFSWMEMSRIANYEDAPEDIWNNVRWDALAIERPARTVPAEMMIYDKKLAKKANPEVAKKVINPMELTKQKALTLLDDCIELSFSTVEEKFEGAILNYLRAQAVSPMVANMIVTHLVADYEPDPDYPEVIKGEYSLEAQTPNTQSLVEQVKLYAEEAKNQKRTRKARISKKKKQTFSNAEKAISKFKYKKADDDLKISSADPIKIVGAKVVLLHNTKYGRTTYLEAPPNGVLSIAGSSVKGFDPDKSIWKACPDPKGKLDWSTKAKALRTLKALNRKEYPGAGRSGTDTVVLAVF